MPAMVQWYSVTGTLGGTVWILLCNFLVYWEPLTKKEREKRPRKYGSILTLCCLILPILISVIMYEVVERRIDSSTPIEAVIVQQNTDPWEEEYSLTNEEEIQRVLEVAKPFINEKTNLVITPESAIAHTIDMKALRSHTFTEGDTRFEGFALIDSTIKQYPNLNFVLGLSTVTISDRKISPASRYSSRFSPRSIISNHLPFRTSGRMAQLLRINSIIWHLDSGWELRLAAGCAPQHLHVRVQCPLGLLRGYQCGLRLLREVTLLRLAATGDELVELVEQRPFRLELLRRGVPVVLRHARLVLGFDLRLDRAQQQRAAVLTLAPFCFTHTNTSLEIKPAWPQVALDLDRCRPASRRGSRTHLKTVRRIH